MEIRSEQPEDVEAIEALTTAAFREVAHSSGTEADIIDGLRKAVALTVSLVAVRDGEVVGHAAFSPVAINGAASGWFGLGPLSVRPDHQRQGVGGALVRAGLDRLRNMGADGCVVLGDPSYYGRFGFESDPELRYGDLPLGLFQLLSFTNAEVGGEVQYHPAFNEA